VRYGDIEKKKWLRPSLYASGRIEAKLVGFHILELETQVVVVL
jgi:hypothetical protein